jgi:hypothetical protein
MPDAGSLDGVHQMETVIYAPRVSLTSPVVIVTEEGQGNIADDDEWEADRLLEMVSHDLINQQQAALGFLEILETSDGLSDGERMLVGRTVEVLERTARLLLRVRTAMVSRDWGEFQPIRVPLDKALNTAGRSVQGAFARNRLAIDVIGIEGNPSVMADGMLTEMLTQLLMLLSDQSPPDRECSMRVKVEVRGPRTALRVSSDGFALNPMVKDALTGDREPLGRNSEVAAVTLVRHLLRQYGGTARMEDAPPGEVGSHLVIELPNGEGPEDAVDNDSR